MTRRPGATSPIALVTGTSSGIGLATAVELAERGYHVVATMRDVSRSHTLMSAAAGRGVHLEVRPLDVVDDDSVATCVADVLGRHGGVDLVVNNAGVGCTGTLEELSTTDLLSTLNVNVIGVARVTRAVLPAMREARAGRIIAMSSMAGAFGQPFNDAYCASKFALEGLYEAAWPVAAAFGVHLTLVQAGPVTGTFVEHSAGIRQRRPDDPFADLWGRFGSIVERSYDRAQTPDEIATFIADVAADPDPRLRYQTSEAVERAVRIKSADPTGERVGSLTRSWLAG